MSQPVVIVEVGARDGLQNEAKSLSPDQKVDLIRRLAQAGLQRIEVAAFVSPTWVPQMKGSKEVTDKVFALKKSGAISKKASFSALVPNLQGMEAALHTELKEVAIFGACSESFSQKNINCSIEESFARFASVMKLAKAKKIKVRAYLSTAFGCPYEGHVPMARVVRLAKRMIALGAYEVSIGDTIGVATPLQVEQLCKKLITELGKKKLAMHFHDTRGMALANVLCAYRLGIRVFDSSVGGLGGCPYAKGASGNLATEDLIYMLHGMKIKTGVNISALIDIKSQLETFMGRKLPSRVGAAGLPLPGTVFE